MTGEQRWGRGASRVGSRFRAAGGTLLVLGDDVVFRPSPLERRLKEPDWALPLAEVTGFRVAGVRVLDAFAGGLRPRLALDQGRGTTHLFVIADPASAAKELLALAAESAVGRV
ncbi:hypothetical protein AB0L40_26280 [Patulibacter sp. NPDC049589]|uniref:hypothetical protein n=1 Tax=Patulibacter sp. NPDC049589 TaxID=3154731 RepID=UPI003430D03B